MSNSSVTCPTKTVYFWDTTPGVYEEVWNGSGNGAPHNDPSLLFNGNEHINGNPDIFIVLPTWSNNTANSPNDGADQSQWSGWLYVEQDGTQLQDVNPNTGERIRIFVDGQVVYENNVDTSAGNVGTNGPFVTLDQGWHHLIAQMSDIGAFAGFWLEVDNGGDNIFTPFTGLTSQTPPELNCREESCDYELEVGEYFCPPFVTEDVEIAGANSELLITREPEYEYYNYWAEEGGGLVNGVAQWSWGNGDTGNIGLPVGNGVELIAMAFHADISTAGAGIIVDLLDNRSGTPFLIAQIEVVNNGQGQQNNMYQYDDLRAAPIFIPNGAVLMFRTNSETGTVSSARVGIWTRQPTGREFLTNVTQL